MYTKATGGAEQEHDPSECEGVRLRAPDPRELKGKHDTVGVGEILTARRYICWGMMLFSLLVSVEGGRLGIRCFISDFYGYYTVAMVTKKKANLMWNAGFLLL